MINVLLLAYLWLWNQKIYIQKQNNNYKFVFNENLVIIVYWYKGFKVFANFCEFKHKSHVTQYGPVLSNVRFVFRFTKIGENLETFILDNKIFFHSLVDKIWPLHMYPVTGAIDPDLLQVVDKVSRTFGRGHT